MIRIASFTLLALALAGCAQRAELRPAAGESLPPAPFGARTTPDAGALLEPPVLAVPTRTTELRSRSEEREDDPFDLPPQ